MGKLSLLRGAVGGGSPGQLNVQSTDKVTFMQSAAPVGWTKQTTHNDKILRVVSGSAGNGGSQSFSSCFGVGKATQSHTLSTPQLPSHNHTFNFIGPSRNQSGNRALKYNRISYLGPHSSATGGSGSHSHSIDLDVNYVDIIVAAKD